MIRSSEASSEHSEEAVLDYNEQLKGNQLHYERDEERKRTEKDKMLDNIIGYQDRNNMI